MRVPAHVPISLLQELDTCKVQCWEWPVTNCAGTRHNFHCMAEVLGHVQA